jgi:hypothetical protein
VGTEDRFAARIVARRVRPARSRGGWWLLCQQSLIDAERKYHLLNLDATVSLDFRQRLRLDRTIAAKRSLSSPAHVLVPRPPIVVGRG